VSIASHFFESPHVLALVIAILIFLITIFLVVKRWIGFSLTLLLLIFSLAAGLIINQQQTIRDYLNSSSSSSNPMALNESQDPFHTQVMKALEDLRLEVNTEKENIRHLMSQVQEIFDSMDAQKQKLQNFIDEVQQRFRTDYPIKQSPRMPESHASATPDL
jgi:hypothetical protein